MRGHGYAYFLHTPKLETLTFDDNGVVKTAQKSSFLLKCPEKDRKPQVFRFELWDTAAQYICDNAEEGDIIYVHEYSPRSYTPSNEPDNYKVVFRIQSFELLKRPRNEKENLTS